MKQVLVDCDGAPLPLDLTRDPGLERRSLRHRGDRTNLTLKIVSPSSLLLKHVGAKSEDLLRISSYVYAADQSFSRGGEADVHGDDWKRDFTLLIPVRDPDFWNQDAVRERLNEILNFASGDYWHFRFSLLSPELEQSYLEVDSASPAGKPDCVYLFSGGLDSLCAVVEATEVNNRRPLLVAHSPAFNIRGRQSALAQALRDRLKGGWQYPFVGAPIHRTGPEPKDYSQRTRSFLFASLGCVIANGLGLDEVCLADNGVVSLGLPTNDQLLSARASRSTHPRFISLFNSLSQMVFQKPPTVTNPLWSRTRPEAIDILKDTNSLELLEQTNSCSHPRNLPKMQSHCGVCSQCIDRRFATLAAEVDDYDPPERYKVDIFKQPLEHWKDRTMALSYVRFAQEVESLNNNALFGRYSELYSCIDPNGADSTQVAESVAAMLHRHAKSVLSVMENQIVLAGSDLAREALPTSCLIRLLAGSGTQSNYFRHSPDYKEVWLGDERFAFSSNQASVVELLDQERERSGSGLGEAYILETLDIKSRNLAQVFRNKKGWRRLLVKESSKGVFRLNTDPPSFH